MPLLPGAGEPAGGISVATRRALSSPFPGHLCSCRSTVLNLGLNDALVDQIISDAEGDEGTARWVLDNYRRLLQMFGDVVRNVDMALFEAELSRVKEVAGVHSDVELKSEHLREVVEAYKGIYGRETGSPFPQDPWEQLYEAVAAVFASWNNSRAVRYRQINEITGLLGEPPRPSLALPAPAASPPFQRVADAGEPTLARPAPCSPPPLLLQAPLST